MRMPPHARTGSCMRRSWALALFGGLVTGLAVATVSVRSHAADPPRQPDWFLPLAPEPPQGLDLMPLQASRGAVESVLGSFIVPSPVPEAQSLSDKSIHGACSADMVDVDGDYCPYVEQQCLRWLDPETKLRCAEFEKSVVERCAMKTQHKRFCIDRYEWPNKVGVLPAFMASFRDATFACESQGKRLCDDTEWTLACEGPERQPYPYGTGFARDDRACNIDKPYVWPRPEKIFNLDTQDEELERLDQREPSGSRTSCVSPYGVHDMVGNVDEWVVNASQSGRPHLSGLKGGYWGPVRTRCRPMTTAHDESFKYYQIGFRCCGDPVVTDRVDAPLAVR
jgi:formylglycine-generating enzyme